MIDDIPPDEARIFKPFTKIYQRGESIIIEGQKDDMGLFLLRVGSVCVYRKRLGGRDLISSIEAINFFGEMALLLNAPRSATVEASSETVVVYAFQTPDLNKLLSNPKWGQMLVERLCHDLRQSNTHLTELREENRILMEQNRDLMQRIRGS
jgi:CRP-like cAMP-binding protein